MNAETLYTLLGELDESMVHAAERRIIMKRKHTWLGALAAAAACAAVIIGAGLWHHGRTQPEPISDSSAAEITVESADIPIYYVQNGEIVSATEFVVCEPHSVFARWKAYNGIGDEVELINVKIESNGTESSDESVASYSVGDRFVMNVTVSANLSGYYGKIPEEQLLDSLKRTMMFNSNISYDECNLIFE